MLFRSIGEAIAAKCGGVALAAQSIGPILETMTYNQWKKVRDSDIWKESSSSSDPKDKAATRVLASLKLSYTFMPRYLKLCFAYWAIFPKGYRISKSDLIHQWISLSFIGATPTCTAWELGEMYITQLLKLSFLQHSKVIGWEFIACLFMWCTCLSNLSVVNAFYNILNLSVPGIGCNPRHGLVGQV